MDEPTQAGELGSYVRGAKTPRARFNEEAIAAQQAQHNTLMDALSDLGANVDRENFTARMHDPEFVESVRTALKDGGANVSDSGTFHAKYGGTVGRYPEPPQQQEAQLDPNGYDINATAMRLAEQPSDNPWENASRMLAPRQQAVREIEANGVNVPLTAKAAALLSDAGSMPGRTVAGGVTAGKTALEWLTDALGKKSDGVTGDDVARSMYSSMAAPRGATGNIVGDIGSTIAKDPLGPLMALVGPNLTSPARALASEIGMEQAPTVAREALQGVIPKVKGLAQRGSQLISEGLNAAPNAYRRGLEYLDTKLPARWSPAIIGGTQGAGWGAAGTTLSQALASKPADMKEYLASVITGTLFGSVPAHLLSGQQKAVMQNFPGQIAAQAKKAGASGRSNRIDKSINPLDIANILSVVEQPGTIKTYGDLADNLRETARIRMNAATQAAMDDIAAGRAQGLPLTPAAEFQRSGGLMSDKYLEPTAERELELGLKQAFPLAYEDITPRWSSNADKPSTLAALLDKHLSGVSAGNPASIDRARNEFMSTLSAMPTDRLPFTDPRLMPHNVADLSSIETRIAGSAGIRPVDTRLNDILRQHSLQDAAAKFGDYARNFREDINPKLAETKAISDKAVKELSHQNLYADDIISDMAETTTLANDLMSQIKQYKDAGKKVPKALSDKANEVLALVDMHNVALQTLQGKAGAAANRGTAAAKLNKKFFDKGLLSQTAWNDAVAKALDATPQSVRYPYQALPTDIPWMKGTLNEIIRKAGGDSRVAKVDEALAMKDALNEFQRSFPSYEPTLGPEANRQWKLASDLSEVLAKHPPNVGTKRVDRGSLLEFIPGIGGQMAKMLNPNTKNYLKNVTGTESQYALLPEAYKKLEGIKGDGLHSLLRAYSAYGPSVLPAATAREVTRKVNEK